MTDYNQLFNKEVGANEPKEIALEDLLEMMSENTATIRVTEDIFYKTHWMRLIVSIAARLSLIVSVWLTILHPNLWYSILIFFLLMFILDAVPSGINDNSLTGTKSQTKK